MLHMGCTMTRTRVHTKNKMKKISYLFFFFQMGAYGSAVLLYAYPFSHSYFVRRKKRFTKILLFICLQIW